MDIAETTAVLIYTDSFCIEGRIALVPGARLTDFVRHAPAFIAVMNAVVTDKNGRPIFRAEFLDIGAAWIELIVPADLVRGRAASTAGATRLPAPKRPTRGAAPKPRTRRARSR